MPRPPFLLQNAHYDLSHLAPTQLLCPRIGDQGPQLVIEVAFSHHTYTVSAMGDPAAAALYRVVERGDVRFFDHERWQLSREHLPGMVAALPAARVEFTWEARNYRYAMGTLLLSGSEYGMFFSLRQSATPGHDLRMVVESAYPVPAGSRPRPPGVIRFGVLAMKVLRGEKVKQPPRR
jgi:hypothetical protein